LFELSNQVSLLTTRRRNGRQVTLRTITIVFMCLTNITYVFFIQLPQVVHYC